MIEYPEGATLARELNETVAGKTVKRVCPPTKEHKFCFFSGDPAEYGAKLANKKLLSAVGFGIFVELAFEGSTFLSLNDGVNMRFFEEDCPARDWQLKLEFTDGAALVFTVAMYGGIILHQGDYNTDYYLKSRAALAPDLPDFRDYFYDTLRAMKKTVSAKAFLATEQRFPGLGNGVLQDILFDARINPKRKLSTLEDEDVARLYASLVSVLLEMRRLGGRDTEKDIYGEPGGYATKMSRAALVRGCPVCGGAITKEAYLGGSVYYCEKCQKKD